MLPRFASASLFAVIAALTPACTMQVNTVSNGENGRVQLAYTDSTLIGQAVDHPMLAGSHVRVSVNGVPEVFAVSENTGVLSVTTEHTYSCCRNNSSSCNSSSEYGSCPSGYHKELKQTLLIDAHSSGNARVQFIGGSDPIDAFTFEVREPASAKLHLESNDNPIDTLTMSMGGGVSLELELRDVDGRLIEAPNGVRLRSDDGSIASFAASGWFGSSDSSAIFDLQTSPYASIPSFQARAAGGTTLRIITQGFQKEIPVLVKPWSASGS